MPFVEASNYALDKLRFIAIDNIRTAPTKADERIIFITNDPSIKSHYSETVHRPNVVITTVHDPWKFSHPRTEPLHEGSRKDELRFQSFVAILSCVEFKCEPSSVWMQDTYQTTAPDPGEPGKKRDPVLQTASYAVEMLSFSRLHAINFCIVGESVCSNKKWYADGCRPIRSCLVLRPGRGDPEHGSQAQYPFSTLSCAASRASALQPNRLGVHTRPYTRTQRPRSYQTAHPMEEEHQGYSQGRPEEPNPQRLGTSWKINRCLSVLYRRHEWARAGKGRGDQMGLAGG